MERRDLLKFGLAAPFVLTTGMARGQDGGAQGILRKLMRLVYEDKKEGKEENITTFYINYGDKYYGASLANFGQIDDADAKGQPTATAALKGARKTSNLYAYYEDGFRGKFTSGVYAMPHSMPQGRSAPVLIQAFYKGKPYTLSGTIKLRPFGKKRAKKMPDRPEIMRRQKIGYLYQKGGIQILRPLSVNSGYRIVY